MKQDLFREFADPQHEYEQLVALRKRHLVPIRQPLVLISQIQRSGGTLLAQLFDGHPECHVHPYEITIGHPEKHDYPDLALNDHPTAWFESLFEKPILKLFKEGYSKKTKVGLYDTADVFPFLLPPNVLRELFLHCAETTDLRTQRDVLDCYMSAYFNAWLDYQQLYRPIERRYVIGFVPRLNSHRRNLNLFFRDYPDGRLISMIRDPLSWYASAHRMNPLVYPDIGTAMPPWERSARAMLKASERYGAKVHLVVFEDLLLRTRQTMKDLAEWLGVGFADDLLQPTFQQMPIKADTSFAANRYGVLSAPLHRHKALCSRDAAEIRRGWTPLYQEIAERIRSNTKST